MRRLFSKPQSRFGLAALLAVTLPAILLGPWLPFHDLVAFVGLDTYPARQSFGAFHYEVLQFTYILHLVASRFMSALGLGAPAQVMVFYLVQAGVLCTVLWRLIERLVPQPWVASVGIVAGALAFWEGQFLWGGPLPCSLAATLLVVAVYLTLRETGEADVPHAGLLVPALALTSLVSHPFALPFALVLAGFRFALVPRRRRESAGLMVGLLVLGFIISRDSPREEASEALATSLQTLHAGQVLERIQSLFTVDAAVAKYLFGESFAGLDGYFLVLGVVHLVGFVISPFVVVLAKKSPQIRALAVLDTLVGLMYLLTPSLEKVLPWWPQRILAFYSPFTFSAAFVGVWFLLRLKWPAIVDARGQGGRLAWCVPGGLLVAIVAVQWPVLRLSGEVKRNYEQVRAEILQTNVSHTYVVMSDLLEVNPVYLRSVSFLLFSDPALVERELRFQTEWHIQARHPTRLVETWFDLGAQQHVASFRTEADGLHVRLIPQPLGEVPIPTRNNILDNAEMARWARRKGDALFGSRYFRAAVAHYRAALRLAPEAWETRNNLAIALGRLGQLDEAITSLQEAIRLSPGLTEPRINLGNLLLELGRKAEAAECFNAALRLTPGDQAAQEGLRRASASN
ncbi:MAG: tetratricopeptide repeat protein [Verrucomicrobia bacterium]|nr:tetratricopeptide repeat protein [Verrucomicrobiota bacterium]